ncbi:hypothetical protein [Agrobacterium sp. Azo12]|uniref:hypothetical protein n=1 Tax=Agrobacterium sp. Azo12 TaxID=3031129 RepID=UPI0023D82061|nr:hypothetical protein [Agrobacterium sp. Azo12]MDO5895514.1 hypothetical protein [Agrobacterium sp. Azo12]
MVRFIKIMFLLLCLAVFAVIALFGPKFWRLNDHITLCFDDYDPRYTATLSNAKRFARRWMKISKTCTFEAVFRPASAGASVATFGGDHQQCHLRGKKPLSVATNTMPA